MYDSLKYYMGLLKHAQKRLNCLNEFLSGKKTSFFCAKGDEWFKDEKGLFHYPLGDKNGEKFYYPHSEKSFKKPFELLVIKYSNVVRDLKNTKKL